MLLSSNAIKLRIYLRTREGEVLMVELENEDLEKAAMNKVHFSEEQLHPVKVLRFELAQAG